MGDYKHAKEAFVSGVTGSSITRINAISLVSFISLGVYGDAVLSRSRRPQNFLLDWAVLVVPVLLSITLFAERPLLLAALTLIAQWPLTAFVRAYMTPPKPASPAQPATPTMPLGPSAIAHNRPVAALNAYRAHMMILTCLSILAVDFPVYPRFLAKCESYGTSMMDIGVGAFVFSQGVVSAIPILRDPQHLHAPTLPKLRSVCMKVAPLILLGVIRVLLVKGTDYPEHVTEYGVHWNFFLTLALLPPLQVLLHPFVARTHIAFIALSILVVHQSLLSFTSLQDYVIDAPRTDLFSMNREGIVSLPGYLAIHILGLLTGTITIPPTPGHFRRALKQMQNETTVSKPSHSDDDSDSGDERGHKPDSFLQKRKRSTQPLDGLRDNGKIMTELFSYSLLWWCATGMIVLAGSNYAVSRRLANLPYVVWTAAYNTTALGVYVLLDMLQEQNQTANATPRSTPSLAVPGKGTIDPDLYEPPAPKYARSPPLFEAVNKNGLAFFLLANLMTGLVNLSMKTMYAGDLTAMVVLSTYSLVLLYAAWALRGVRLIKL